ncbi:MAG: UbiD family decarboxylase [Candidatus Hodarchaeota archaeon]
MSSLRGFIEQLKHENDILIIEREVSPVYQIAALMKKHDNGPALLFENVKGSNIMIAAGTCGTRDRLSKALNIQRQDIYPTLVNAMKQPTEPNKINDAPVKEVEEEPDLTKFPIVTHYAEDKTPYITAGVVFARDPETGVQNASIHRLMVMDRDHLAIRIVPRQLFAIHRKAKEKKASLDIAIAIGLHPAVMLASCASVPLGVDEMQIANTLLKGDLRMTRCNTVDIMVPADAEIVLEGRIMPDEEVDEGPFVDITGTYDVVRKQPVIEIANVLHRKEPIYSALLSAGSEHKLLMGLFREVKIWEQTKNVVPDVRGVNLTLGGSGWLHAVISIRKQTEGDGKNAILAAFSAHGSLKHAVVVDEDIDPYDMDEVEWAIATRVLGDKDILIIPNIRGSSLDPMGDQERALTTKVGIDATHPLDMPKEKFRKAKIPGEEDI